MNLIEWSKSNILHHWKLVVYATITFGISPIAIIFIVSPVKYVFLIFIWTLTMLLVALISSRSKYVLFDMKRILDRIDFLLIGFSLVTVLFNWFFISPPELKLIVSEIVVFFLPGWFLIRLCSLDKFIKSSMAILVLSFIFSIGLSSLLFSLSLAIATTSSPLFISAVYLGFSLCSKLVRYKKDSRNKIAVPRSLKKINLLTMLILFWIFLFFLFTIISLYPRMADIPGYDIIRHVSNANQLLHSPELYTSEYPWFHFPIALLKVLSNSPDWLIHMGMGFLSIILIFSFYIMANRYFFDIDSKAAVLSTIFFFIFAGFGWLYFLQHFNEISSVEDYFRSLSITNSVTYWDVGFGGSTWLWFWFRPLTVGFSILFTSLYLLRHNDFPRKMVIPIIAFLVIILSQTHISELVLFVGVVLTSCFFIPSTGLRLKETLIALLLGLSFSAVVSNSLPYLLNSPYQTAQNITLLQLFVATIVSFVFLRLHWRKLRVPSVNIFVTSAVGIFVYLVFALSWLNTVDYNALQKISTVLAVPWEFYPVLLGVVGLIAVPGAFIALRYHGKHPVIIFVLLFLLSIFFGRIVTYFNLEIAGLGYWERRTVPFVFVSASILGTLLFGWFLRYPLFRNNTTNNIAKMAVISCLVLFGTFSTFLSAQYQFHQTETVSMTTAEHRGKASLENIGSDYTVLTANSRASDIVDYYNPGYLIGYYKFQIWPSKSPELPLIVMSILDNKSAIYLNVGDYDRIKNSGYGNGFIASYALKMGEHKQPNQEGLIILPRLAPPQSNSELSLVLAEDKSNIPYDAYSLLSNAGLNYTTVNLSDLVTLNKSKIIVAPTEDIGFQLQKLKNRYNLGFDRLVILNLDGYGALTKRNQSASHLRIGNEENDWITQGINKGSIGVPSLSIENDREGDLFSIKVGNGSFSLWQVYRKFQPAIDLDNYDLFKFDWYGRNDSKYYVIEFNTQPTGSFWYRFQDLWTGWKQVSIPMHSVNGSAKLFGTSIASFVSKDASWHNVTRLNIRTESSNINNSGTFTLKALTFEYLPQSKGIESVSSVELREFPSSIKVVPISTENSSVTKAIYENTTVPYLIHQYDGNLDTWYVNIYPIVSTLKRDSEFAKIIYPEIGDLLLVDLPYKYKSSSKDIRSLVSGGVIAFRTLNATGDFQAVTESAIMMPLSESVEVTVDKKDIIFDQIDRIVPIADDHSVVKGTNLVTKSGYGFYLSANSKNSSVSYYGKPARVILKQGNSDFAIVGENITVKATNAEFTLRQPSINISGKILMQDLYAYGELNNKLRSLGNDLRITGTVKYLVQTSDEFTLTKGTTINGQSLRDPPLYFYNDLSNLTQLFDFKNIRHIIAISFILILITILLRGKRSISVGTTKT